MNSGPPGDKTPERTKAATIRRFEKRNLRLDRANKILNLP
jgi:hypothetical protein